MVNDPPMGLQATGLSSAPSLNRALHIAWAAGDAKIFGGRFDGYWPDGVPRELPLEAFIAAFKTLGYEICDDVTYESGVEKIAIYVGPAGPLHAARQVGPGNKWTSKLGKYAEITHRLMAIEGPRYGKKARVLKRRSVT